MGNSFTEVPKDDDQDLSEQKDFQRTVGTMWFTGICHRHDGSYA